MYTQCPHCQTIFGVSEAHLSAAFGRVRCGHCRGQFNAKRHLLESIPEQQPQPLIAVQEPATAPTEPPVGRHPADLPEVVPNDDIEYIDLSISSKMPVNDTTAEIVVVPRQQPASPEKSSPPIPPPKNAELDAIFAALDHRLEELSEDTPETVLKPYEEFNTTNTPSGSFHDAFGDPDSQTEDDIKASIESIFAAAEAELGKAKTPEAGAPLANMPLTDDFLADIDIELLGTAEVEPLKEDPGSATPPQEDVFITESAVNLEDLDHAMNQVEDLPADKQGAASEQDAKQASRPVFEQEELPFLLHDTLTIEESPPRSWPKTVGLASLILVLIIAIGFQLALFRNVELANKIPELQPYLVKFCQSLPCQFTGQRDVQRIHLTSRDVRANPDGKNTILISAIFVNNARFDQPYPDILITLSDLTTTVVAQRRFTPHDYLANNKAFQLMKTGKPVQITLEVLDPGNDAVNFQFDFL